MFILTKSQSDFKMGHVGLKTRSPGQILGKPCVRSRGYISSLIIRKLGQNVCHDEISDDFENGSWTVTRSNVRKTLCML